MSYNMRRGGGEGVNSVGARRPTANLNANFVSGGQLARPQVTQQQQQPQQAGMRQPNVLNNGKQQQPLQQRPIAQPAQPVVKEQPQPVVVKQQPQPIVKQQPQPIVKQQPQPIVKQQPQPIVKQQPQQQVQQPPQPQQQTVPTDPNDMQVVEDTKQRKAPWTFKGIVKLPKKERQRRRNLRLGKILQPKNATMILNEIVRGVTFTVNDATSIIQGNVAYTAQVTVDGNTHQGIGTSKMDAKNAAAEAAIKQIVKTRMASAQQQSPTENSVDSDGDVKMESIEGGEGTTDGAANDTVDDSKLVPWQHVASLALHKLLNSWGEPNLIMNRASPSHTTAAGGVQKVGESAEGGSVGADGSTAPSVMRPAKKMPEHAADINPIMLLNQMLPHARFEELSKVGTPPNVTFTYQCTVDGQNFYGSGPNKKAAKKLAAYAVCWKILNVIYSPDVYSPKL